MPDGCITIDVYKIFLEYSQKHARVVFLAHPVAVAVLLRRSIFGRSVLAVGQNPRAYQAGLRYIVTGLIIIGVLAVARRPAAR